LAKEAYYFSHDANARNQINILCMRSVYGMEGYGVFWAIIEMLSESENHKLLLSQHIEGCTFRIEQFIKDCIEFEIFETDGTWFWTNEFKFKNMRDKTHSRLYNTDVKLWYRIRNEIFERDNYTCFYCGERGGKLEADHIKPFSKGGTNDLENLTTSCRRCNRQKKDKTVEEFEEWRVGNGKTT
jgi:uncharacterized protein YbaR (Trm112 family)